MPYLVFRYHKVEVPIPLSEGLELVIGRSRRAHIKIGDSQLSRQHLKFEYRDGKLKVTDLDSRNGTFVNKQKIRSSVLSFDDKVNAGKATFTLRDRIEQVTEIDRHFTVFAECPHCFNAFYPDERKFDDEISCKFCEKKFKIQNVRPVLKCDCGKFYNARKVSPGVNFKCPNCQKVYPIPSDVDPMSAVRKFVGEDREIEIEPEPEPPAAEAGTSEKEKQELEIEDSMENMEKLPDAEQLPEEEVQPPEQKPEQDEPAEEAALSSSDDFEADMVFDENQPDNSGGLEHQQTIDSDSDLEIDKGSLENNDLAALSLQDGRKTISSSDHDVKPEDKPAESEKNTEEEEEEKDQTTDFELL